MLDTTATAPKQIILDAAQHLITRHGYAGLSMRELSQNSGLAKGTIYYYFQDKQSIYLNVLERDMILVQNRIAEAAQTDGDCIERLRAIVEAYFDILQAKRSVFLDRLREISCMEEPFRALVQKHRERLVQPLIDLLEEGIALGLFRQLDTEMAVISLFGMMNGYVAHQFLLEQQDINHSIIEHTLTLFLQGTTANN